MSVPQLASPRRSTLRRDAPGFHGVLSLFDWRNIPDDLGVAYTKAFPGTGSPLYEHYSDLVGRGEESVRGFVSSLKGKLSEIRIESQLENWFPGYDFELAADPTQAVWDLKGVSSDGLEDILVQVKMQSASAVSDVIERMEDHPEVLFAVSQELFDKITDLHPELADQLVNTGVLSSDLGATVHEKLELLAGNFGIDVPDSIGEVLPYIGEIILGIRLILDIAAVERDFKSVAIQDRKKVHALKALILLSRFGVTTVCTTVGGAAGSALAPGLGTVLGSLGGAGLAWQLNRKIMPHIMELAMGIMRVTQDDMFYFRNKPAIDGLAMSFANTAVPAV